MGGPATVVLGVETSTFLLPTLFGLTNASVEGVPCAPVPFKADGMAVASDSLSAAFDLVLRVAWKAIWSIMPIRQSELCEDIKHFEEHT